MISRRKFIVQGGAGLVAARFSPAQAADQSPISSQARSDARRFAPDKIARIKVVRRDETLIRHGGNGDNWHMSWAADDRQYVSQCDGYGWSERPRGMYNSRLLAISGGPRTTTFQEVSSYPDCMPGFDVPRYYGFGTLALDGSLYQFLSTWNRPITFPIDFGSLKPKELRFVGAKLIYSPDNGRTWRNQDGSSPVVWESWDRRSRKSMVFFEEDQEAFSQTSILQMGRNYEHNRDGYVYIYGTNGNTEGTMNQLVMLRVPKAQIRNRGAYEYFAGWRGAEAKWAYDITARSVVHTFPHGWVNTLVHPFAWQPSVVFNAPLGLYLMTSWGTAVDPTGLWFAKPNYLGFWAAARPWGPWTQIHEETTWMPGGDANARAFAPQIAPKWIAPDGKSFWLVWSDFQARGQEEFDRSFTQELKEKYHRMQLSEDEWVRVADMMRRNRPFYAFNTQRVDLVLS